MFTTLVRLWLLAVYGFANRRQRLRLRGMLWFREVTGWFRDAHDSGMINLQPVLAEP